MSGTRFPGERAGRVGSGGADRSIAEDDVKARLWAVVQQVAENLRGADARNARITALMDPERASERASAIAGAGFEPATFGL